MARIDRDTFRKIFINNWAFFLVLHPSYAKSQFLDVVNKMLGCGTVVKAVNLERCKSSCRQLPGSGD